MHNTQNIPADILAQVKKCAAVMRAGGIAAYPTDTVYGLGADVYNGGAVTKVFAAKQRPLNIPLPVLIADTSQLNELTAGIPPLAKMLMDKFWPGALTIIFNKAPGFNSLVLAGGSKIAVRLPDHPLTLRLMKELGHPIVGTSANLHDRPAALTASEVREQLGGTAVDFILDGGPCPGGVESTVVDVTVNPPAILRQGAIPGKDLADLLNRSR
ncbi:MAG: L-threonylcarbamoyladenylate synthase [Chloroflexi bacterium]|nr:L-threonylcarbamoyladenylate synthase [Chloroflexota bacterium]